MLKKNNVQFQTLFPARLRVRHDDRAKIYDTMEEAVEDLLRRGYTVAAPRPPETLIEQVQWLTWKRVDKRRGAQPNPEVSQATGRSSELSGDPRRHPPGPKGATPSLRMAESRVKSRTVK